MLDQYTAMRLVIADSFTRSLGKLDPQSQNLVKQAAFDLQMNPENPGFKLHRLDRARDKRFWSARVSLDIRLIDVICWHIAKNHFRCCW
ncbi:MAG: hypothetical protein KDK04_03395 [Candidatus Competibacteraceae bacterium]|nr:hypothetical protein [Candidatus Competibacteraceae bacterium]MCB1810756.1 hypothetical protein [Candidatus Competibacteraceae bacterium]